MLCKRREEARVGRGNQPNRSAMNSSRHRRSRGVHRSINHVDENRSSRLAIGSSGKNILSKRTVVLACAPENVKPQTRLTRAILQDPLVYRSFFLWRFFLRMLEWGLDQPRDHDRRPMQ